MVSSMRWAPVVGSICMLNANSNWEEAVIGREIKGLVVLSVTDIGN